jgi:CPA2 family monovalent cation:H+ antiporter-2
MDGEAHATPLIVTIVAGLGFAFLLGMIAAKLRLPPIVGYLLAGVVVGPHTPGLLADGELAAELAEIGVILLMFGVGLHFSIADLWAVRRVAITGAIVQILLATLVGIAVGLLGGWDVAAGLVLGLSVSVASTVVLLRTLDERNALASVDGRIAIGWLIVEDLVMVLTLVLLPAFGAWLGGEGETLSLSALAAELGITLLRVAVFGAVVLLLGARFVPWLLRQVARTGSRELFTLAVLGLALGIAFAAAELAGVSFALGAFLAGIVLSKSELSHRAAAEALPLQNAFAVLFFVSVGMLFDYHVLLEEPLGLLAVLFVIVVAKPVIAAVIVVLLGYPLRSALVVGISLAQIGEFSFILASLGVVLGLFPQEGRDLVLAAALLSITLNAFLFRLVDPLSRWLAGPGRPLARREGQARRRMGLLRRALREQRHAAARQVSPSQLRSQAELARLFPLLRDMSEQRLDELISLFLPRSAQPGERLFRAGDRADMLYFILEGSVEVELPRGGGVTLSAGEIFGEMALLSGKRRSADVVALDYCQFLTLTSDNFEAFVRLHPALRERLEALAGERNQHNQGGARLD